jgi:hypothetical protein
VRRPQPWRSIESACSQQLSSVCKLVPRLAQRTRSAPSPPTAGLVRARQRPRARAVYTPERDHGRRCGAHGHLRGTLDAVLRRQQLAEGQRRAQPRPQPSGKPVHRRPRAGRVEGVSSFRCLIPGDALYELSCTQRIITCHQLVIRTGDFNGL